jgi:hypothetical protein
MAKSKKTPVRFVTSITLKSGKVIYAKDYGYKAFPISR